MLYRKWKSKLIKKLHRSVILKQPNSVKELNRKLVVRRNGFVLLSLTAGIITHKEVEKIISILKRYRKRRGILENYCFLRFKLLRKSKGVRMGKGKGTKFVYMVYTVNSGKCLFGLFNLPIYTMYLAMNHIKKTLSLRSKIIYIAK